MRNAAQHEELQALRAELHERTEEVRARSAQLAEYGHLPEDVKMLRELNSKAEAEAREAVEQRERAEREVLPRGCMEPACTRRHARTHALLSRRR